MKLNRRITRESIRQRRRRNGLSRAPTRALSGSLGWDWRTPKYAGDLWDTALHGQRYVHHRITIGFFLLTTRRPHVTLHGFFGQFRRHFCSRWVCAVEPAIACQDFATIYAMIESSTLNRILLTRVDMTSIWTRQHDL
jgi:hypothetical protein